MVNLLDVVVVVLEVDVELEVDVVLEVAGVVGLEVAVVVLGVDVVVVPEVEGVEWHQHVEEEVAREVDVVE